MPLTDILQVLQADLDLPAHRDAIVRLLDAYAQDEMGIARPLDAAVRDRLVEGLRQHPSSLVFLAEVGSHSVGLAVCFLGYSTFAARPLINIHDLIVDPKFRRQGVGERLLGAVEARGQELGCSGSPWKCGWTMRLPGPCTRNGASLRGLRPTSSGPRASNPRDSACELTREIGF